MSDCHGRQADGRSIAQRRERLQAHVATLDRPFIVLLQQQSTHEPHDGCFIGEYADGVGAPLDLTVEPLEWVVGVDFGPVRRREPHVGQHVHLGVVHQGSQAGHPGTELVGDAAPLFLGPRRVGLGKRGADPGRDDAALGLARVRHGIAHEMHAGAVEKAFPL